MTLKDNTIWHLAHSSFSLKLDGKLFIFDYYMPESDRQGQGLAQGFIDPEEIADEETYVLNSHSHPDHYNRVVFDWEKAVDDITYIMSSDIRGVPLEAISLDPFQEVDLEVYGLSPTQPRTPGSPTLSSSATSTSTTPGTTPSGTGRGRCPTRHTSKSSSSSTGASPWT